MIVGFVDAATPAELNFYQWSNDSAGGQSTAVANFWKGKDIDLGSPGIRKKIYKVYVTYKCTGVSGVLLKYLTNGNKGDGSDDYSDFDSNKSTNYSTSGGFTNSSGDWQVAELKPSSSINNIYSFQLSFYSAKIDIAAVASTGDSTTIQLASDLGSTDYDEYHLYLYGGPGRYNSRRITAYNTSNQTATVDTLTDKGYGVTPTTSTKYILGVMAQDFEINDITVIFRPKPVK